MKGTVDLYNNIYGNFTERVLAEVRAEAFGKDIGQNSWITAEEMRDVDSTAPLKQRFRCFGSCLRQRWSGDICGGKCWLQNLRCG